MLGRSWNKSGYILDTLLFTAALSLLWEDWTAENP